MNIRGVGVTELTVVQSKFVEYIESFPSTLWVTITFTKFTSQFTADKRFRLFIKDLNSVDTQFYKHFVTMFVFYEKNTENRGVHIHALIDRISVEKAEALQTLCQLEFGESVVMGRHEGVTKYLAEKYNTDELIHWDILKINSRYRSRKAVNENIR